ncbi:MAG TPA: Tm-1-like ATP-binding domain-containing protein [Planctomicrobium sp.]|nr:Tm-1-like ATP-binding domain-containing protein [Planctomicrobium sp.]
MPPEVLAIATMDTKGEELAFVARQLRMAGVQVCTVDVGTGASLTVTPAVARETVAACHPQGSDFVLSQTDRGKAVDAMGEALRNFLLQEWKQGELEGVIGIGGSGGTALITKAMRALPVGLPKLMVSTVASGNVAPYVDCTDITMMYSVVDVAGINNVSSRILANAAHAMAGMVLNSPPEVATKPVIGMTMFGVTTPCVTEVRTKLEHDGFDAMVFHATGAGGRAMEKLVESGMIQAVLDITTTEVADEVVGGVFPAGADRFDAILRSRIPYVMSLGALDMVNFGAPDTIPPQFRERSFHQHNSQVTLMRTTPQENRQFARWIVGKLKQAAAPVIVLVPERGVSALDAAGQPFDDPVAREAFIEEFESLTRDIPVVRVIRLPLHINDPAFAEALIQYFYQLCEGRSDLLSHISIKQGLKDE